ncbi:MAG: hypothetical protein ACP5GX_10615, partial [Anaerolineae bacterium]
IILLLALPVLAQDEEPPPPLAFAETEPLTANLADLQEEPLPVEVLNNTTRPLALQVQVTGLEFEDLDEDPLPLDAVLTYSTTVTVPQAAETVVALGAISPTEVHTGTYGGYLILVEADSDTVLRRELEIVVGEEAAAAPEPLVESLTVRAYRKPFSRSYWLTGPYLPLEGAGDLDPEKPLGFLVGDAGGVAAVKGSPIEDLGADAAHQPGLRLSFEGLETPGTYEGEIDLAPKDEEAGAVSLTVEATDIFLFPAIALGVGVLLAVIIQRWIGGGREIWEFQERLARIGPDGGQDFRSAQKAYKEAFDKLGLAHHFPFYAITTDLGKRQDALEEELVALNRPLVLDRESEAYTSFVAGLEFLEEQVEAWGQFAATLDAFQVALEQAEVAIDKAERPPLPEEDEYPRFYQEAESLPPEDEELSLETFQTLRAHMTEMTQLAGSWGDLEESVQLWRRFADSLALRERLMTDEDRKRLNDARNTLSEAWVELWRVPDLAALKSRSTEADILLAEKVLSGLARYRLLRERIHKGYLEEAWRGGGDEETADEVAEEGALLPQALSALLGALSLFDIRRPPVTDAELAEIARQVRKRRDTAIFVLAVVAAIFTGLTAQYFGQTFGTWGDYVGALLWGVGTKAALEGVSATLEKFLT